LQQQYLTIDCSGIEVCFEKHWDGGGTHFGGDYVTFLRSKGLQGIGRAFEWCAGPGFIGFHLLGSGVCDSLCLADVNGAALRCVAETVRRNHLEERVTIYEADGTSGIPAGGRWGLVVGDPPHYGGEFPLPLGMNELLYRDVGWQAHRRFLTGVGRFLEPGAPIILQENYYFTSAVTFAEWVGACGLRLRSSSPVPAHSHIYYLWLEQNGAEWNPEPKGRWEFPYAPAGAIEERHYLQHHGYLLDGVRPKPRVRGVAELIDYRLPFMEATHRNRPAWLMIPTGATVMIEVENTGESWSMTFASEGGIRLQPGSRTAAATVTAHESVFIGIFERRQLPLLASMNGSLRIVGQPWIGLQFVMLLCNPFLALEMQDWGQYWDARQNIMRGSR